MTNVNDGALLSVDSMLRADLPGQPVLIPLTEQREGSPLLELVQRITESVWDRLPYAHCQAPLTSDSTPWIEAYLQSFDMLRKFQRELIEFLQSVWKYNLRFWQESGSTNYHERETQLKQRLATLAQRADATLTPPANVLSAQRVGEPAEVLTARLHASLRSSVEWLGLEVVELLQWAVHNCQIGLIDWTGSSACHYVYFLDVVAQQQSVRVKVLSGYVPRFAIHGLPLAHNGPVVFSEWLSTCILEEVIQNRSFKLAMDHHILHARQTSIRDSQVVAPPDVERLLNAVPPWLYEFVRVVEGQLIREQVVVADRSAETTRQMPLTPQPTLRSEPVLALGPFVLTGWTQRDIDAEQQLLDEQAEAAIRQVRERTALWEFGLWSSLAVALILACDILYGCTLWVTPGMRIWFAVAAGMVVLAATQVARAFCEVVGVVPRWYHRLLAGVIASVPCVTACLFLLSVSRGRVLDSLLSFLFFYLTTSMTVAWLFVANKELLEKSNQNRVNDVSDPRNRKGMP